MRGKPIFFDPTDKRARRLQGLAWGAGTVSAVIFLLFTAILVVVNRPEDKSFDQQLSAHTSIRLCLGTDLLASAALAASTPDRRRRPSARGLILRG